MKRIIFLFWAAIICCQASFASAAANGDVTGHASTDFGLRLLSKLSKTSENVFVSPLSILGALEMTMAGAANKTHDEMAKVLGLNLLSQSAIEADYKQYIANLLSKPAFSQFSGPGGTFTFQVASSLWANEVVKFRPDYLSKVKNVFNAECNSVNFKNPATVTQINKWVSAKTNGRIPSIITALQPEDILVLIDTTYFKARWKNIFDKTQTAPHDFHLATNKVIKAPMMKMERRLSYYEDNEVQCVLLPYTDSRFAMCIALPNKKLSFANFVSMLNTKGFTKWVNGVSERPGTLLLPKFKTQYKIGLNDVLSQMGMAQAFTKSADFSLMTVKANLAYISDVIHKTFIDVNEEGTEAAAATAVTMAATSMPQPATPFAMLVDRPFFFAIVSDGNIIFAGTIVDPRKN